MNLRQAAEQIIAWYAEGQRPTEDDIVDTLREALAQPERRCEAGVSLQDLWDCWEAVHGGKQEPIAWIRESDLKLLNGDLDCCLVSATRDFTDRVPLYLHPAPIPEGWQLVPKEPTKNMSDVFWSAYIPAPDGIAQSCSFEDFHDFRYMYKTMLAAAPKYEEQEK